MILNSDLIENLPPFIDKNIFYIGYNKMLQEQYWKEFWRLKVQANYVDLYLARTERNDRVVKIILAIASSGSVGGWIIWKDWAVIWATFIAVSQFIDVIRQYLPYKERIKSLSGFAGDLEELVVTVEDRWLQISSGDLKEEDIRKGLLDLRSKKTKSFKKHFFGSTLPEIVSIKLMAEDNAAVYFSHIYSTKE